MSILVGGLEHFVFFFHILGISSSQLTNSYFFAGVAQPPTGIYLSPSERKRMTSVEQFVDLDWMP